MGDYDYGNSDSDGGGSIIGAIISILILAAIWPYLLAILGLYLAYMAAMAVLNWITQNPLIVICILVGLTFFYGVFHYRLIPKFGRWMIAKLRLKEAKVNLYQYRLSKRKFMPSTDLYCYWCTKKLGNKAQEKNGKFYCDECR